MFVLSLAVRRIRRIQRVWEEMGQAYWEVDTDKGWRRLCLGDRKDGLMDLGSGRYIVMDVDGNWFEIPEVGKLERRSRALLGSVPYGMG